MSCGEGQLRALVQQDQNVTIRNPENLNIEKCIEELSLTDQIKEVLTLAAENSKTGRYFNVKSPSHIKSPFNYKVPSE